MAGTGDQASLADVTKDLTENDVEDTSSDSQEDDMKKPLLDKEQSALKLFFRDPYAVWVAGIITFVYSSNQLNRFILTSVSLDLESGVGFGEGNGESFEYAMLAGPITTLPYCAGSIVLGHLGDNFSKVKLMIVTTILSSIAHAMLAFANDYWLVAVLRGVSVGVAAGYVSMGPAIIADFFPQEVRGIAIGVFGWGQPIGHGLVFAVGNYLTSAYGYRTALFVAGIYILPFCVLMLYTIKESKAKWKHVREQSIAENEKSLNKSDVSEKQHVRVLETIRLIVTNKVLVCMYIGGAFKYISVLNWQFFRNQFFQNYHGLSETTVAAYMSWIPIVGGIPGAIFFGWISDQLVKNGWGALARLGVVAGMHVLAVPMIAGVVFTPMMGTFAFVFFDEVLQRYFISGISTAIIHMIPSAYRVSALAYGWMFYWLIGGNSTLLAPIVSDLLDPKDDGADSSGVGLQRALAVLYLGGMCFAAAFFCAGTYLFYRDQTAKGVKFGPGRYHYLPLDHDHVNVRKRTLSVDGEDARGVVMYKKNEANTREGDGSSYEPPTLSPRGQSGENEGNLRGVL